VRKAPLAAWLAFILVVAGLNYAGRAVSGKPPKDLLYEWSTVVGNVVQYAVILAIVYGIAGLGDRRELFAMRRPTSWRRAGRIALGIAFGMVVLSAILTPLLNPGREQGYTPSHWEARHAAAYIANGLVITVFAPIVEELTFRGLGFSLLQPLGAVTAIVLVGLSFGVWHGLVEALPLLVAFGAFLAYLRYRVDSVYPGMIVHGLFNAVSLTIAVAH
jgi:membrane protease YdiL (CAAX protease family)